VKIKLQTKFFANKLTVAKSADIFDMYSSKLKTE